MRATLWSQGCPKADDTLQRQLNCFVSIVPRKISGQGEGVGGGRNTLEAINTLRSCGKSPKQFLAGCSISPLEVIVECGRARVVTPSVCLCRCPCLCAFVCACVCECVSGHPRVPCVLLFFESDSRRQPKPMLPVPNNSSCNGCVLLAHTRWTITIVLRKITDPTLLKHFSFLKRF